MHLPFRSRQSLVALAALIVALFFVDTLRRSYAHETVVRSRYDADRAVHKAASHYADLLKQRLAAPDQQGEPLAEFEKSMRTILTFDNRMLFVAVDERHSGKRWLAVNEQSEQQAPALAVDQLSAGLDADLFPQPGIDLIRVELRPLHSDDPGRTLAIMNVGYALEAGGLFSGQTWFFGFELLLLTLLLSIARRNYQPTPQVVEQRVEIDTRPDDQSQVQGDNQLQSYEATLPKEEGATSGRSPDEATEIMEITTSRLTPDDAWVSLLPFDKNPKHFWDNWHVKGNWYRIGELIVGNPWRSSIVRRDHIYPQYLFRFRAKKVSGRDGFILLFPAWNRYFVWVIGGWNNAFSEIAGIAETRYEEQIQEGEWYNLLIEVLEDKAHGFVNNEKKWEISSEVDPPDFSAEFPRGLGCATFTSLCKFKDMFILDRSDRERATDPQIELDDETTH